jgi:cell division protein ZapE
MGPVERYRAELVRPGFVHDPAQELAVEELQRVYEELTARPARGRMRRLVSRVAGDSREPVVGL